MFIKKAVVLFLTLIFLTGGYSMAKNSLTEQNAIPAPKSGMFKIGKPNTAYAKYFKGQSFSF